MTHNGVLCLQKSFDYKSKENHLSRVSGLLDLQLHVSLESDTCFIYLF